MEGRTTMTKKPHIAFLPSPGMGHLIPHVELAKQLVLHHEFSVTFIVPTIGPPTKAQISVLEALPEGISYMFPPPITFDEGVSGKSQISLTISRSLSFIHDVFKSLVANTRLVALVIDIFGTDVFDVAMEFKIPSYLYFLPAAMTLSFTFYMPKLDEMVTCEYRDLAEPVKIPGSIPVHGRDLPEAFQDRKKDGYKWVLHHVTRYCLAEGVILNSFMDLEPGPIKALQDEELGIPPIYPIGPQIQTGSSSGADGSGCLKWLDDQPSRSVLYVSFGSGGTISYDQLIELALGLEMSEQKFLWVLRSPNDKSASTATYLSLQSDTDPLNFLPEGFLGRTKGQGLVVPSWAPQIQVLSHGSTGGFLTHCGWNSTLESIVHGVPLIAWPLFAGQRMNAVMLSEGLNVALRPKANENGLVGRDEIAKVVKGLMQGEEGVIVRDQVNRLEVAAAKAVSEEGSSTKSLSELVHKWKNHKSL